MSYTLQPARLALAGLALAALAACSGASARVEPAPSQLQLINEGLPPVDEAAAPSRLQLINEGLPPVADEAEVQDAHERKQALQREAPSSGRPLDAHERAAEAQPVPLNGGR